MMGNIMLTRCVIILFVLITISGYYIQVSHEDSEISKPAQVPNKVIQSCNCVAFRLDDIQGYWLNNAQIAVMDEFQRKDIPLTIGIIGGEKFQFGVDPKITDYVKNTLSKNDTIRIANHGWNHEDFTMHNQKAQSELLKKSNQRISEILGVTPRVFIPPFNEFDDNTVAALQENHFTHFSPSLNTYSPSDFPKNSSLYVFPETATTGVIGKLGLFEGVSSEETFEEIQKGMNVLGFAVVMMHPQEFSIIENKEYTNVVNGTQIRELESLLNKIHDEGLQIVFLEDIDKNVQSYDVLMPEWFEKIIQWNDEGKISDVEFSDAINYLKKQDIIKFDLIKNTYF